MQRKPKLLFHECLSRVMLSYRSVVWLWKQLHLNQWFAKTHDKSARRLIGHWLSRVIRTEHNRRFCNTRWHHIDWLTDQVITEWMTFSLPADTTVSAYKIFWTSNKPAKWTLSLYIHIYIYTGCFTTLGHNCRRWFPRPLWSKKLI
jgi:hypothetical protein